MTNKTAYTDSNAGLLGNKSYTNNCL